MEDTMKNINSNQQFCQSCGMPLAEAKQFGTENDDSKNQEYCIYCYKEGKFTDPDITMEGMIDKCAGIMANIRNMPMEKAKAMTENFIPNLKRWQK